MLFFPLIYLIRTKNNPRITETIPEEELSNGKEGYNAFAIAKATYITIAEITKTLNAPTISSMMLSDQCFAIFNQIVYRI